MNKPEEQFDAEMLIVADRSLDSGANSTLFTTVIDSKTGEKVESELAILEVLSLMEEMSTIMEQPKTPFGERQLQLKLNDVEHWISMLHEQKAYNKRIMEILNGGKVKVGIWIDSEGGETDQLDKVSWALDFLGRNGGTSHSYISIKTISAAFDMAFLADQINALNKSIFMWHFSDDIMTPHTRAKKLKQLRSKGPLDETTSDEWNAFLEILESADDDCKDQVKNFALAQINLANNSEGEVFFEGEYLHDVGIVDHTFKSVDAMVKKFKQEFPLHSNHIITQYTSGVAQRVFQKLRNEPNWLSNRALTMTSKVIKSLEKPNL